MSDSFFDFYQYVKDSKTRIFYENFETKYEPIDEHSIGAEIFECASVDINNKPSEILDKVEFFDALADSRDVEISESLYLSDLFCPISDRQKYSASSDLSKVTDVASTATSIVIEPKLLLDYLLTASLPEIDLSVDRIVKLVVQKTIICHVLLDELKLAFADIPFERIHHYLVTYFGVDPIYEYGKDCDLALSLETAPDCTPESFYRVRQDRSAVLANVIKRIQRDFIIVDISEELKQDALALELLDENLAIKIAYCERNKLTAVVTSNSFLEIPHGFYQYELVPSVRIYNPSNFVESYDKGFSDASPEIQLSNYRSNKVDSLNRIAGFCDIQDDSEDASNHFAANSPLPQIGDEWYFVGFEVYSTARLFVSATLNLKDRIHGKVHTFVGTGTGMISALLNAVDIAATYLVEHKIVKINLPMTDNICLFHIIDCDRDINAPVSCEVLILYLDKYYAGSGKHTDTVKSALIAYYSALIAVLKGDCTTYDHFSIDGVIIASKYKKGERNFSNKNCYNTRLIDYKLTKADFSDSNLSNSIMAHCTLIDSHWQRANLAHSTLTDNDFTSANLSGANFTASTLTDNNFTSADLSGANFTDAIVSRCRFIKAILQKVILIGAVLIGSNFTNAILTGSNLTGANLTNAVLANADLTKANLTNAILTNADLNHAILIDADLTGANLAGADLTGADLRGVNLKDTILDPGVVISDPRVAIIESIFNCQINPNSVGVNL
jgi:uncharacterized protein YjbI with pentapeptide repeats